MNSTTFFLMLTLLGVASIGRATPVLYKFKYCNEDLQKVYFSQNDKVLNLAMVTLFPKISYEPAQDLIHAHGGTWNTVLSVRGSFSAPGLDFSFYQRENNVTGNFIFSKSDKSKIEYVSSENQVEWSVDVNQKEVREQLVRELTWTSTDRYMDDRNYRVGGGDAFGVYFRCAEELNNPTSTKCTVRFNMDVTEFEKIKACLDKF